MGGGVTTFIALRVGVNASRVPPKDVPAHYGQDALFVKRWLAHHSTTANSPMIIEAKVV